MATFNGKEGNKMVQPEIRFKMPNWYYDKKALQKTPSFMDGISNAKEMRYRREGVRLIVMVGIKLGLIYETIASGTVYFHRFYMFHSFKQFPRFITSCCCLLLAGKVEETPKKCKQIIATAQECLTEKQFQTFGANPREEVMTLERILLKTIKFDLQVSHPYQFILKYVKGILDDRDRISKIAQKAWDLVNNSFETTLCLQWEPEIIAIAAIYLALKLGQFQISDWQGRTPLQNRWWEAFASEVSNDLLEDIGHQILDHYQPTNPEHSQESPPEEENSPNTSRKPLPASPHSARKERKDNHSVFPEAKKLQAPPMPPMVSSLGSVAPPLPKEPPQYFAPPPTEPPPHQGFPPLPPIPPQQSQIASQAGLGWNAFSHPLPALHPGSVPPREAFLHARPIGASVPSPYAYFLPVGPPPPPQEYSAASSHQFYQNNSGGHHMTPPPLPVRPMPQTGPGPIREHYRNSAQQHPYMRGQGTYMIPRR